MYLVVSHFYLEWRILKCCCWDQLKIWGSVFGKVNRCIGHQSTYVYVPLNCTWLVGHIIIITLCNVNSEEAAAKKKYFWSQSSVANFVEESLAEYEDGEKSRHRSWLMRTTSFTAGRKKTHYSLILNTCLECFHYQLSRWKKNWNTWKDMSFYNGLDRFQLFLLQWNDLAGKTGTSE